MDFKSAKQNYIHAVNKGLLKVLSKMGNSTLRSYRGAHIFEALGISSEVLNKYFRDISSKIEGIDLSDIAREVLEPYNRAFALNNELLVSKIWGFYAYRKEVLSRLESRNHSFTTNIDPNKRLCKFKEFTRCRTKNLPQLSYAICSAINATLRHLGSRAIENIMKRFAQAPCPMDRSASSSRSNGEGMNIIGGRSNTGRGKT
jgi:glutamate synthase (NADPH/NADH) large chain